MGWHKRLLLPAIVFCAQSCSKSHTVNNVNSTPAAGDIPVSVTVETTQPGITIPADFTGLSFETSKMPDTTYFNGSNTVFINYLKTLGVGILRIGGNSVDQTHWTNAPRTAVTGSDSIATTDADRLFAFAGAAGWKVMYALNLGSGSQAAAVSEAKYVYSKYSSQLLCFEIGNEPDLYHSNGLRGTSYAYANFKAEFDSFYTSIKAVLPNAVFSGPATASATGSWVVPFAGAENSKVKWVTQHYYKMGPPTSATVTIPNLLNGNTSIVSQASAIAAAVKPYGIPYRISECNSVYDGGKDGVSNTMASALWGLDYMFALAEQGDAGVNFHGGGAGIYTPVAVSSGQYSARPLYYGMLLFKQASAGRILPLQLQSQDSLNITGHAVLSATGAVLVTLINKDASKEAFVTVATGGTLSQTTVLRLLGPGVDATTGITLGGATVNANGAWAAVTSDNAAISANACTVRVPAASALLLKLQ